MNNRKIKRITIQVSEREEVVLRHLAREENMNMSDYLRRISIYEPYKKMFGETFK